MLEEGQIFNKDGYNYCVLDIIDYNNVSYALFSRESDKLAYVFYEIYKTDSGYSLVEVKDEELNFILLNIFERKVENE